MVELVVVIQFLVGLVIAVCMRAVVDVIWQQGILRTKFGFYNITVGIIPTHSIPMR